jgi:CDP-diacylglycerol--serine O-phosphatidyltransferase
MHALGGDLWTAGWFVLAGAFLDFFDGMTARKLKVSSKFGGELDSLADLITFGLAPAAICSGIMFNNEFSEHLPAFVCWVVRVSPLIIVIASAIRLAKFNVQDTEGFVGLPTLANALFWVSIGWYSVESDFVSFLQDTLDAIMAERSGSSQHLNPPKEIRNWFYAFMKTWYSSNLFIMFLIIVFSYLMTSDFVMLSFKNGWSELKKNQSTWVMIIGSVLSLLLFNERSLAVIITLYIVVSLTVPLYEPIDQ